MLSLDTYEKTSAAATRVGPGLDFLEFLKTNFSCLLSFSSDKRRLHSSRGRAAKFRIFYAAVSAGFLSGLAWLEWSFFSQSSLTFFRVVG